MKQWDIYSYHFREGEHPAVVFSPDEQCLDPHVLEVNVLFAASIRPVTRALKPIEVALDESDGLDWKTAVRCHRIVLVRKDALVGHRGRVCSARQREICRKIATVFRFQL